MRAGGRERQRMTQREKQKTSVYGIITVHTLLTYHPYSEPKEIKCHYSRNPCCIQMSESAVSLFSAEAPLKPLCLLISGSHHLLASGERRN